MVSIDKYVVIKNTAKPIIEKIICLDNTSEVLNSIFSLEVKSVNQEIKFNRKN